MSNTSNNVVSNGLIGSTVSIGYGAIPPVTPLTVGTVYTTNNTGQFLTSTGNGTSWSHNNIPDNILVAKNNPPELEVKGRLVLNGLDVEERLKTIERVLTIPERDVILEKKHPKLKKLYDDYINALGKYRTFQAIKGED
jgi:hypothetical protein